MAVLRKRGTRVTRGTFRPGVRLSTRGFRDLRGRGRIRGRTLRNWRHVRRFG